MFSSSHLCITVKGTEKTRVEGLTFAEYAITGTQKARRRKRLSALIAQKRRT